MHSLSNVLLTPVNTTLLQELCTGSTKVDAYSPQRLNAFKVGHYDRVIESTPPELIVVLSTGEIMVLSTGIGNGPTVVVCTLIKSLPKIRVHFSCINMLSIQFLSFHFCDFYSLPLNRQALVHRIPNTHTHKNIIKMSYMVFKISYRVLITYRTISTSLPSTWQIA